MSGRHCVLVLAVLLALLPPGAAGSKAEPAVVIDPELAKELAAGPTVAILIVEPDRFAEARSKIHQMELAYHVYPALSMFAVGLTRTDLDGIVALPGLTTVFRNEHMHPYLDKAAAYVGAPTLWKNYKLTGKGVTIMIVDTGVDGTHSDVKYQENLVENVVSPKSSASLLPATSGVLPRIGTHQSAAATDGDGHGTHVASIAGGRPPGGGKYQGVAHGATLVGFQAGVVAPGQTESSFESTTVLDAFDFAIAQKDRLKIRIVSNSWGANGEFEANSPINRASFNMYKSGLVVTFAAGNEGAQGAHTLNRYSTAPWVLAVAAGDYANKLASFSSRGTDPADKGLAYDHPDVTAPGVGINAAKAVTANAALGGLDTTASGYTTKSGTSMATPVVSGIAALLLEARPDLSPDEVYDILTYTAKPLPTYQVWEAGAGYVNALDAYQVAKTANGTLAAFLKGKIKYGGADTGDPKHANDPVTVGYLQGASRSAGPSGQNLQDLGQTLIGTVNGLVFVIGLVVLGLLAFRPGGGR